MKLVARINVLIVFIVLVFLLPLQVFAAPGPESSLKISSNGRYLINADSTPFFYQGDTAWVLFYSLTLPEVEQYLDERKARGFNVIQIFGTVDWTGGDVPIIANIEGERPFINDDPEQFNPAFWNRVNLILAEIRERDMYAAISVGTALREDKIYYIGINNHAKAYRTGYSWGQTLKDYNDIIIWVGGQDMNLNSQHAGSEPNIRAQMEGIADAINDESSNYNSQANYDTTLMTYHPCGLTSSGMYFQSDEWLDFNWYQTYGNLDKAVSMLQTDYARTPIKPVLLAEGTYEDTHPAVSGEPIENAYIKTTKRYRHYVPTKGTTQYYADEYGRILPWHNRYQAYQTVFAGGAGIGYGHRGHIQTLVYEWSREKARNAEGAKDLLHLHNLMDSYDFLKFVPDNTLIASEPDSYSNVETNMVIGTRATDNKRAYIYTTRGRSFTAALSKVSAGDKVIARWLNPRTGEYTDIGEYNKVNTFFDPPGSFADDNDWVLVLESKNDVVAVCGDGTCDAGETCECSDCPTPVGSVCCSGNVFTGNCCDVSSCSGNQICSNYNCIANPICGDGVCNGDETCECSDCPTPVGEVCCTGNLFLGTCCSNSDCTLPDICINNMCKEKPNVCDNLILLMHFDEDSTITLDESENRNNGTVNGATYTSQGQYNGAFEFDGIANDEVNLGNVLDVGDDQDFTITGWFNRKTFTSEDVIIAKRLATSGDTNTGYLIYIDDNGDNVRFRVSDGVEQYGTYGETTFTSQGWHFFAAVFDADSATNTRVYIDGIDDTGSTEGTFSNLGSLVNNQDLRIGNSGNNAAEFPGLIDEISMWNRTLSASEIKDVYDSQIPISCEVVVVRCGDADVNVNGKVDFLELYDYVNVWKRGNLDMSDLIVVINLWKDGCS